MKGPDVKIFLFRARKRLPHKRHIIWSSFAECALSLYENLRPDDPAYIRMILSEAEQIVPRKRNHPSLALWVWLEDARDLPVSGIAYFVDNYFCLLPGEQRPTAVSWQNAPEAERRISVRAWNTDELVINKWDDD